MVHACLAVGGASFCVVCACSHSTCFYFVTMAEKGFSDASANRRAVIKNADMSEEMQQVCLRFFCPPSASPSPLCSRSFPCVTLPPAYALSRRVPQDAVDAAGTALTKYSVEKDVAAYIKREFDKKYNPTWHCIVGRNFGSYVTHETKHFIYFYMGQIAILLFKSG